MAKEQKSNSKAAGGDVAEAKAKAESLAAKDRDGIVWVRDDGAICVGNECIVIKPEPGSKNLDIEIAPTQCGEAAADAFMDHLLKTVGKGGNTRFTVKSELQDGK